MKITVLKSGNRIVVDSQNNDLIGDLLDETTFEAKEFQHRNAVKARIRALQADLHYATIKEAPSLEAQIVLEQRFLKNPIKLTNYRCAGRDRKGRFATSWGFYARVCRFLKSKGFKPRLKDLRPDPDPSVFEPQWDQFFERFGDMGHELRADQERFLEILFSKKQGRMDLPTGFGKTFMIGVLAMLLPRAKIHVTTKRASVLEQRIYPELVSMVPDVGLVKAGRKQFGHRIMCFSAGSLHHSDGVADYLLLDEAHELAADTLSPKLAKYLYSRNYGLSATNNMRADNKDFRIEAACGPIVMVRSNQQAVDAGIISPIKVRWRDVIMTKNPCSGVTDMVTKQRRGIWRNHYRNSLIRDDARKFKKDVQVLITVSTIDHAVHLKKLLPEFTLVYAADGLDSDMRQAYIDAGLLRPDEPIMTHLRRSKLDRAFTQHRLRKAICTTVWNVGVSFKDLRVLIRADGEGSDIKNVQIPGRLSRLGDKTAKKSGLVIDYMDQFDDGFRGKAKKRYKTYKSLDFEQKLPPNRKMGVDGEVITKRNRHRMRGKA